MTQETTPIRGRILADAYGLGKTLSALCLIYFTPEGGRQNMRILRTLALAAFNPLLLDYLRTATLERATSSFVSRLVNGRDHGFEAVFLATCRHPSIARLKSAEDQAYYLCKQSPRLSMLLRILDFEGAFVMPEHGKPRRRFLIICHWPIIVWMVEMLVACLGFRTVTITAAKKLEERAAAIAEFTSLRSTC
jgi:hypothetical protein